MNGLLPVALLVSAVTAGLYAADQAPDVQKPVPSHETVSSQDSLGPDAQSGVVRQYCVPCHNERMKTGGLSLAAFDASRVLDHLDVSEKMIRKLRAGMMPPAGVKRPDDATIAALAGALETRIDTAAAADKHPGSRPFQRLNRAEYARAVKDLLGLDVDVTAFLPADTISDGFDNVADVQSFSPTLMEGYLRAAGRVAALAIGDPDASTAEVNYRVPRTASQLTRVEGAPFGTRGGLSVVHTFPADGDYVFRMDLHANADGVLFGGTAAGERIEVSIDGARAAVLEIDQRMIEATTGLTLKTAPVHVRAGAHRLTAAFLQQSEGPVTDLIAPIDHTLADTQIGVAYGITTLPHLRDLSVVGPHRVTGVSETPTRRRIFTCRPTSLAEEGVCASTIVRRLAIDAFRGSVSENDVAGLMRFYEDGRKERDFENGISFALEAILASPQFLFRLEPAPATAKSGQPYRIGAQELASRLAFFIWAAAPDAELLAAAANGRLATPAVLEKQVRRMLADSRSEALATRFASQWLRLQDVENITPDALLYPYYDHTLGAGFVRETQLFFNSLVREDRSLLDLLTADYTFVNERVARHYGIPGVTGTAFRRVPAAKHRNGLLGHGSILLLTSVADRTSPVMRGKWVMEVLLGSPPPPPPPNVPLLEETNGVASGKVLSVRARMEEHRKNPACTSCHRAIDPLGLALENFDVTGRWRINDGDVPIDASGELYDGTKMDGPDGLRAALLKHKDAVVLSFTESLMTYALGRRVETRDMPTVRQIIRDAARSDYRMSSFVLGIARSAAFLMNAPAAVETAARQPQE
jgi:hypothetical protein